MNNIKDIEKVLIIIKSKIKTHNEFKRAYNKQLAFDFNMLNFFSVGENKVSEILAFFLDKKASHGQGDIFLVEFLNQFYEKNVDVSNARINCEEIAPVVNEKDEISSKRRIDLFIELNNGKIIAIENKIGAADQKNQLLDYSKHLQRISGGNYLLLYLNPDGSYPNRKSISKKQLEELINERKFNIISYWDIIDLLNRWISKCEAENVIHFLKQFKQHIEIKILNYKTSKMSNKIKKLIYEFPDEVKTLVFEYNLLGNVVFNRLKSIKQKLSKFNENDNIEIKKQGIFKSGGRKQVYKFSFSKGLNKVWLQVFQEGLDLYLNHYLEKTCDSVFRSIVRKGDLYKNAKITDLSDEQIVDEFKEQIKKTKQVFHEYDGISKLK